MIEIPEDYRLGKIAQDLAKRMNIELNEEVGNYKDLRRAVMFLSNTTDHFLRFALGRHGHVKKEIVLMDDQDSKSLIHYSGAIFDTEKPIESLYANNSKRVLIVTWGFPEYDHGVLEVLDIKGSIALEKLSGVRKEMGGRSEVIANVNLPISQPYKGVSNFQEQDFDKLSSTIETLLD